MPRQLTLADMLQGITGLRPAGLQVPVHPIIDSRQAAQGAVFFAFAGEHVDGHDYVADAFERGASAAVVAREMTLGIPLWDARAGGLPEIGNPPLLIRVDDVLAALQRAAAWWRGTFDTRVIGITGSVGKTTTKQLVAHVLEQRYRVLCSGASYNNELGLPLTLLQMDSDHERVVLEMGMYVRGDISALAQIARPQVGVITNVAPVHAERAGSIEAIALGKRELVEALPAAPNGVAILNYDDARVRAMAEFTDARTLTYGLHPEADLRAEAVESLGLEGLRLNLCFRGEVIPAQTSLLGRHSAHTALRAAAVGLVEGLDWPEILEGLRAPGARLRLQTLAGLNGSMILDDTYNSSPPSALAALDVLAELPGRRIAVLGDMLELGAYEEEGHLQVGCRAAAVVDRLVTVGQRGRILARGAADCGLESDAIRAVDGCAEAAAILREWVEPGDVILVKGSRGMRMEQIVAELRVGHA